MLQSRHLVTTYAPRLQFIVDAAEKAGVTVTDADIEKKMNEEIDAALKPGEGQSEAAFRREIEGRFGSIEAARQKYHDILNDSRDDIRKELEAKALEKRVRDGVVVTEDDYKRSVTKLNLYQIEIEPKFPAPNTKDFKAAQAKNNADAAAKIQAVAQSLKATPTLAAFQVAVKASSDDAVTKSKGGSLGWKLPSDMSYTPGMSDLLSKTPSDVVGPIADAAGNQYLFFIAGRNTVLPKDYAKNKAKLLKDFQTKQADAVWQAKQDEYKKVAPPLVSEPALLAYQMQTGASGAPQLSGPTQDKLIEGHYQEALNGAPAIEAAAINLQLSQLYQQDNNKPAAIAALQAGIKADPHDANLHIELARTLHEAGKTAAAVAELAAASQTIDQTPSQPSMFGGNPDDALRQQIASEYTALKMPAQAGAQLKKIKPAPRGPNGLSVAGSSPFGNVHITPGH